MSSVLCQREKSSHVQLDKSGSRNRCCLAQDRDSNKLLRGSLSFIDEIYCFHWTSDFDLEKHMPGLPAQASRVFNHHQIDPRRRKMSDDRSEDVVDLEPVLHHLEDLLSRRKHPKTLCPSEAARALSNAELKKAGAGSWRDLMPAIRSLCFQMRDDGELEILQRGQILPGSQTMQDTRGPIRIRKGLK